MKVCEGQTHYKGRLLVL